MKNKQYEKQPITKQTLNEYLKSQYQNYKIIKSKEITKMEPLLQNDYGGDMDCTLTSITTAIHHKLPTMKPSYIYERVERIAKHHWYKDTYGTFSITVKSIYEEVLTEYGLAKRTKWKLLKGIGITSKELIKALDNDTPIILNFMHDGRKYQSNHTVLLIGYDILTVGKKTYYMFRMCDNWNKEITFLDWQLLSFICSANY